MIVRRTYLKLFYYNCILLFYCVYVYIIMFEELGFWLDPGWSLNVYKLLSFRSSCTNIMAWDNNKTSSNILSILVNKILLLGYRRPLWPSSNFPCQLLLLSGLVLHLEISRLSLSRLRILIVRASKMPFSFRILWHYHG